jgi:dCMP deaminase
MSDPHKWDRRWMERAKQLASWSKDPSTKVGCVLVNGRHSVAEGYNGFPKGVADTYDRLDERSEKYPRTVHAEANAVAFAARAGHRTEGTTAYVWGCPVCTSCATLLIQAGVRHVVIRGSDVGIKQGTNWDILWFRAYEMLREAGVLVTILPVGYEEAA